MPVNLSVKNVPEALAGSLRRMAKRHHRSLQGELLAILHAVVAAEAPARPGHARGAPQRRARRLPTHVDAISSAVAPRSESALIIRAAREGRTKTPAQLFDELSAMGTGTPAESAAIIRKSRSSR